MIPVRRRIAVILTAAVTAGGGCAGIPDRGRVATDPAPRGRLETPSPRATPEIGDPQTLAEQARRDVDAILEQQAAAKTEPRAAVIRWSRQEEEATAAAAAKTTAPPEPAVAITEQEFVPGPLFRVQGDFPGTAAVEPAVPARAATVADALATDRADELAVELSRELYRRSTYGDVPLRELLVIAALSINDPERELSPDAIPGLTPRERETLEHFQAFCRMLGRELEDKDDADEVLVAALTALKNDLVEPPRLGLPTATLCYHVDGFGRFRAFDRSAFLAGSGQQVIVYLEIDDFTSETNEKGEWVTELSQQLTMYSDRDGIPVWKADWQTAVDVTRNKRKDFFTVQVVALPDALGVGRYHLKIRVRDEKSGAEAESGIEFEMVADPGLAARIEP